MADSDDVSFMLRRALPLCLTDTAGLRRGGQAVSFDVSSEEASWASVILFRPLLLLTNALHRGEELYRQLSVVEFRKEGILQSKDEPPRYGEIDFDQTAEMFARGVRRIELRRDQSLDDREVGFIVAAVSAEFLAHAAILVDAFGARRLLLQAEAIDTMVSSVRALSERISRSVNDVTRDHRVALSGFMAKLTASLGQLRLSVGRVLAGGAG